MKNITVNFMAKKFGLSLAFAALFFMLLAVQSAFAVTDYMFFSVNGDTSGNTMVQGDSVGWGCNCDTAASLTWEIWLDINANSVIDSLTDIPVVIYTAADGSNNPNNGLPDISATPDGWYITPAIVMGIAPGDYIFKVTNLVDQSEVQEIVTCSAIPSPANRFRGHIVIEGITAPDSAHLRNIWVEANLFQGGMQLWSSLTNDSGRFEINIGDVGTGLEFEVRPKDIAGYVSPGTQTITASGVIDSINFTYTAPTDSFYGEIRDENDSLVRIPVDGYCSPSFSGPSDKDFTATNGAYIVYFGPSEYGQWNAGLSWEGLAPAYLGAQGYNFDNSTIHSQHHDFICYTADTVIFARVTENGDHPTHQYIVQAQSSALLCGTQAVSDIGAANLVTLHITSLDPTSWIVNIGNWNDRYPIPDGYILDESPTWDHHPGDTVALNFISGMTIQDTVKLDPGDDQPNWNNVWVGLNASGSSYGANPDNNGVFTIYTDTGSFNMNVNAMGYLGSPASREVHITADTTGGLGFDLNKAHCRVSGTLVNIPTPLPYPVTIFAHTGINNSGYTAMASVNTNDASYSIYLCDGSWTIDPPSFQNRIAPQAPTLTVSEIPDTIRTVNIVYSIVSVDETEQLPSEYWVSQNYPNPFNAKTVIGYNLVNRSQVKIKIMNLLGETVRTLIDRECPAGKYMITWDGTDNSGNSVATGLYFYRIQAGQFNQTRKMLLLK